MYREKARNDYLALSKCRKLGAKKIRKAIRKQLHYIRRDIGYVLKYLENHGVELSESDAELLELLETVYAQQLYMFIWKTHSVDNRIVSISQPYISPIVRGKAKSPVEFGAKLDLSFDAYNENSVLQTAVENYKKRTLHYTEHILANQIYRSLENITFCNGLDIRLSGK